MTTPTAEVVETKEGKPIPFLPFVVQKINGFDEEYLYSFKSEEEAKREVDEWLCTSSVLRARILRLPSEREAELQPLRAARDRAAVEFSRLTIEANDFDAADDEAYWASLHGKRAIARQQFMDAQTALAAAEAARGGKQ